MDLHTSPDQTESQVDLSIQLESTCESVWPGFNFSQLTLDSVDRSLSQNTTGYC